MMWRRRSHRLPSTTVEFILRCCCGGLVLLTFCLRIPSHAVLANEEHADASGVKNSKSILSSLWKIRQDRKPSFTNDMLSPEVQEFLRQLHPNQIENSIRAEVLSSTRHKTNRRNSMYNLSVHGHYKRLLDKYSTSQLNATEERLASLDLASCDYYNEGLQLMTSSILEGPAATDESKIFSQFSHWSYRLCLGHSLHQIHYEPLAIAGWDDVSIQEGLSSRDTTMALPKHSIFASDIQMNARTSHSLGTYLSPSTPNYEHIVKLAWDTHVGEDDTMPITGAHMDYYIDGDYCSFTSTSEKQLTQKRQSRIVFDPDCCNQDDAGSMLSQFFNRGGTFQILSTDEPEPCRYVVNACQVCGMGSTQEEPLQNGEMTSPVDPTDMHDLLQNLQQYTPRNDDVLAPGDSYPPMSKSQINSNKEMLKEMFQHSFDSYFYHAFPASELKPLSCTPGKFDLVRVPALTLIDTLDTLVLLRNFTEFARSIERLRYLDSKMKAEFEDLKASKGLDDSHFRDGEEGGLFGVDQNVSLFECTIRVLGGLLSAHQLALAFTVDVVAKNDVWDHDGEILVGYEAVNVTTSLSIDEEIDLGVSAASSGELGEECLSEMDCSLESPSHRSHDQSNPGECANPNKVKINDTAVALAWEYDGILLVLAKDIGDRLKPAFETRTGIPFGTVNLLHGVPENETPVASLAGAGTLTLEFELLSRLTGDATYGNAAKLATRGLWIRRSNELNLYGKHIDSQNGKWRESLSGVGSNSDSFYEYMLKHYILFPEDDDFWVMFLTTYSGVYENSRLGEWYVDVDINSGMSGYVRQVFESLQAFYPGLQILLGEVTPSSKSLNSFFLVREFLGLLPERFNYALWKVESEGARHPLRPELLESCYFLHLASVGLHGSQLGPLTNSTGRPYTSSWLWAADFALHTVNKLSRTPCGFATVLDVSSTTTGSFDITGQLQDDPINEQRRLGIRHQDEMPSYFLSETIKYLYLTFDSDDSILHTDSERDWIFTTEAHPIHTVSMETPLPSSDEDIPTRPTRISEQMLSVRSFLDRVIGMVQNENIEGPIQSGPLHNSTWTDVFKSWELEGQVWAKKTTQSSVRESLDHAEAELGSTSVSSSLFERTELAVSALEATGIYASELSGDNLAHLDFHSYGRGHGRSMKKSCNNIHHPSLRWSNALHGSALEYNVAHVSSLSQLAVKSYVNVEARMKTGLASVAFHGTEVFLQGLDTDLINSCGTKEDPGRSFKKKTQAQRSSSAPLPGSTRYEMGLLGQFDVGAYPGGDGFIVRHINSEELLEVSIFSDRGIVGEDTSMTILTVLTVPPYTPPQPLKAVPSRRKESSLSSWRSPVDIKSHFPVDLPEEIENGGDFTSRYVVVSDNNENSFHCEIALQRAIDLSEEMQGRLVDILTVPCSPGFFGQTTLHSLRQTGGTFSIGNLIPPPDDDEIGCKAPNSPPPQLKQVQMVRRGRCSFQEKTANYRNHADAIIVINSKPSELFVMSGDSSQIDDSLPMSVLVSGNDGEDLIRTMTDEKLKGHDVFVTVELKKQNNDLFTKLPYVKGTSDNNIQILCKHNWGINAVAQGDGAINNSWQLYITQHHGMQANEFA